MHTRRFVVTVALVSVGSLAWSGSIFSNTPDQCSPAVPALGC
jgi:hypothetical protein